MAIPPNAGPGVEFLARYLRDLSFETPYGPCTAEDIPQVDLQRDVRVEVNARPGGTWEVNIVLVASGTLQGRVILLCEMTYSSQVRLHSIPDPVAPQILGVDVPQALLADVKLVLEQNAVFAGWPPIELANIDFLEVYRQAEASGQVKRPAPAAG